MKLKVMKFGGTSVGTKESRAFAFEKIGRARREGYQVIAVASAMGRRGDPYATDTLIDMLLEANSNTAQRELDIAATMSDSLGALIMAVNLQRLGHKAFFLNGGQAGILTNGVYGDSRVVHMDTGRLKALLEAGYLPVLPGGQGVTEDNDVTMLGRGGSDTTACTLGVALGAQSTEIYTDVNGIMTADPRIVPEARLIERISYQHCIVMAALGAKVMHPRSVETAARAPQMPLYVRGTKSDSPGTLICEKAESNGVVGITLQENDSIFRGRIDVEEERRLKQIEVSIARLGDDLFAVSQKDQRRFIAAPAWEQVDACDRVSLVGTMGTDVTNRLSAEENIQYHHAGKGYLSLWVQGDGKEITRRMHSRLIQ